ncbi:MAG: hypothetical protein EP335_01630 [Alphaproteobacteria bacterium]|nr:MAG: hypothetical protein EP335_01630 [Alphaproteobacteria bacterium]
MTISFSDAPYGWIVLAAFLAAGFAAIVLALRLNGHRLDTATSGHSYFWGYLVGFHYIGHYSVTMTAYLAYGGLTGTETALVVGLCLAKVLAGFGLLARLREAWIVAGILFFGDWLLARDIGVDLGGLVLMLLTYIYLRKRWGEFSSLLSILAVRRLETEAQ